MRKVKTLIGQDVLSLVDGHRLATVNQLVVEDDHRRLSALVVKDGGLSSDARVVPIEAVHSFGKDAVVITKDAAVVDAHDAPDIERLMGHDGTLVGRKVFSSNGEAQGRIADAYFEEASGSIVGYEVSMGLLDDLASGRSFLPVDDVERVGDEVVYVRAEAIDAMKAQRRPAEVEDVPDEASTIPPTDAERTTPSVGDGTDLIGKRAGLDVTDDQGGIVVANGQRITEDHVVHARESGDLEALRSAADAGTAAERERVVGDAMEQAADTAGSLWDRFTRALSEMVDAEGQRMTELQAKERLAAINDAVGRPVTKVILDRSDDVILNLGDIVTHEAIQRAHDAGMLETLLASVYTGNVTFERDEMRTAAAATSTVEDAKGGAVVVDELHEQVTAAEQARLEDAELRRQADEDARARRDAERQARAQTREEAARRAAAGEPEPGSGGVSTDSPTDALAADGSAAGRLAGPQEAIIAAQGDPPAEGTPAGDRPTAGSATRSKGM